MHTPQNIPAVTLDDLALMIKKGFDEVGEKFSKVDTRLATIEKHLAHVETGLTNVETRLSTVEKRLTKVEERFSILADHVDSLDADVKIMKRVITNKNGVPHSQMW